MSLFIEDLGDKAAPPLLYLHGGPGTSCYDFVTYQRGLLPEHVRLIAIDQRGVLRSPAIAEEEDFGLGDLIQDLEAVRRSLGIDRWSVLGHSFGGYIAAAYANSHPAVVEKLLIENGSIDLGLSARSLLRGAALEHAAMGSPKDAAACLNLAFTARERPAAELWGEFTGLTNSLGERRNNLYVHGLEKNFFERLVEQSPFPPDDWGKAGVHQRKLFEEGKVFESLTGAIPKQPTLLLKGKYDYVMSLDQIQAYMVANPNTSLVVFENSSHFPHAEEAERFSQEVTRFIC